ncbi:MAG: WecB/TagA/CpsF family glycosyltransferase [Candidatus Melainabacteria bacterium]|nr:WecB/TagA/CpsF family glycosyltransferase [Candidatus Melainabacteria bacterium]
MSHSTPAEPTHHLLGYPVHCLSVTAAVARILEALAVRYNYHVVTLNPEMMMQAENDRWLHDILQQADLSIPDGAGVVWGLRLQGLWHVQRLPGIELSEALLEAAGQRGLRIALIGTSASTLELTQSNLMQRYPGLSIVYAHHGFFDPQTEEETIARRCAETQPHFVLVALGVPRQEKWIALYKQYFDGAIFLGVGGSFDVWANTVKRAPRAFQKLHLEWLYRFIAQPWRIRRAGKHLLLFLLKLLFESRKTATIRNNPEHSNVGKVSIL